MKMNMKKILSWGMMLAAAFTLTNCAKEIDAPVQEPETAGYPFEIVASTVDTKTVNDGMSTKWAEGDQLNVFHVLSDETNYVNDGAFTVSDIEAGVFTGTIAKELDVEEEYDWFVMYPYSSYITTPGAKTDGYTYIGYSTGLNQTGYNSMASLKGSVCPLYGVLKCGGVNPKIEMQHLSSVVAINVTNETDEPLTVTTASFTATEDIVGSYFIDITKTPVEYTAKTATATATVNVSNGTALAKGQSAILYAAIKPFAATAGQKLILSVNGYSKEITLSKDVTFAAGKIKTLNFSYDKVATPAPDGVEYTIEWDSANDWVESCTKYISGYYTVKTEKNSSSTEPTVNASANDCRVYAKGSVTISHAAANMKKIVFNISAAGMKRLTSITASEGTVTVDAANSIVVWEGDAESVEFTVGDKAIYGSEGDTKAGQLCFDSIDVIAEATDAPLVAVLKKIELNGMTTEYTIEDEFEFDGVVTAYYYNQEPKEVEPTSVSQLEMTVGNHSVVVSYTEGGVTMTATYSIIVDDPNAVVGEDETKKVTFSSLGYSNAASVTTVSVGDATISFNKGTNSNAPKYYTSGSAVRAYGGNYFTISAPTGKNIKKVVLTFGSSDGSNAISVDSGNFKTNTWEGKSNSVKFTIGGTSGNRRLSAIEVTYEN